MIISGSETENITRAADVLKNGGIVGFPTETVYGLGADAFNVNAVEKIFRAKGRPFSDPLIVHVADLAMVDLVAKPLHNGVKKTFEKLARRYWPGPLTIVVEKSSRVPGEVTAGLETVGIRWPAHRVAQELIVKCGSPLAAPSANRFQSLSPTTAAAVESELGDKVSLILDGGPCQVGLESTVLSLAEGDPVVLRLGGIALEDLSQTIGAPVLTKNITDVKGSMMSPGMMEFHYAPRKPLRVFDDSGLKAAVASAGPDFLARTALVCFSEQQKKQWLRSGFAQIVALSAASDFHEAARALFETLRKLDGSEAEGIYALQMPDVDLGRAINDRLKKAQHGF